MQQLTGQATGVLAGALQPPTESVAVQRPRGMRRWLRRLIEAHARPMTVEELQQSAIVFAPHPDDETLGCGAAILHKRAAGADVRLVYLLDGRQSHGDRMPAESLVQQRRQEGIAAAAALGIPVNNVTFLGIPDGSLARHLTEASARVAEMLREFAPRQIYVPTARDITPDHKATSEIVSAAARQVRPECQFLEYFVWFWAHWPWARRRDLDDRRITSCMATTARSLVALARARLVRAPLEGLVSAKWDALNCHVTQMRPGGDDQDWPTLGAIWGGRFLECHFCDHELFIERKLTADSGA